MTAAAVGAIAGARAILVKRALIDLPTALIAAGTFVTLVKLKRFPEPMLIFGAGVLGLVMQHLPARIALTHSVLRQDVRDLL